MSSASSSLNVYNLSTSVRSFVRFRLFDFLFDFVCSISFVRFRLFDFVRYGNVLLPHFTRHYLVVLLFSFF